MAKKKRKAIRRARGTGSIFYSTSRKTWVGRKVVGRAANGKPVVVERWADTQGEVVAKLAAAVPPGKDCTVAAWAVRWLAGLLTRPATIARCTNDVNTHILPAIGHLQIVDVKPSRIERLAVDLQKAGMHVNSVRKVLATANGMMGAAIREDLIAANPVAMARKPRGTKTAIDPYTPAELRTIVGQAGTYAAGPLLALLAACGCRVGEAIALDVPDWNAADGTIAITKTYTQEFGLGPPKSSHSVRTITVPAVCRPLLALAAGGRTKGPLFLTRGRQRYSRALVRQAFARACKRMRLAAKNPHQLRHSVATALISGTPPTPIGDVAKYLGDTVQTVVTTYLHASGTNPGPDMDRILEKTLDGGDKVGGSPPASLKRHKK